MTTNLAFFSDYTDRLNNILKDYDWTPVAMLAEDIRKCWLARRQVFLCGNGGSAGNAMHLANDYLYGIAKRTGAGLRVNALPANSAVMTCLANDVGYDRVFSEQLAVQANEGDLLIALSGSGNSPNIVAAIEQAKEMGVKSYAILGFSGGKCKALADVPIHFAIDDMQIAEDLQMVVGHMLMQWLYVNRPQLSVVEKEIAEHMDKMVVIGSNSFSGASFVDFALDKPVEIIGTSRSAQPVDAMLPYKWRKHDKFKFHQLDLNTDLAEIIDLINQEKPEYVVNFAAQSMVAESWQHPADWFMTNTVSTIKFHDALRKCDFIKRYVHVSTPEVYGSCSGFVDETFPFNPSTPYAVSRAAADMSLRTFYAAYKFPVVTTRAANVYGPGQQLYRIIPRTILFIMLGKKLQLHGGGASTRSFIHMKDVSDATWRIMTDGENNHTYHISTDEVVSIRELVERICQKLNVSFDDHVEVVGERLGKDAAYHLDSTKVRKELDWKDHVSLDQGLDECIAWVKEHLDTLKAQPYDYSHKP